MTSSAKKPPLLFARQRQLLALLDALGGRARKLDFQKLLFLYCQEVEAPPPYEFVPYKYGAFSFTSYADRRKLIERGLLADQDNHWQITASGRNAIAHTEDVVPLTFARRYRTLRGDALVAETYRRFPYYAIRSEIAPRVLADDETALDRIQAAAGVPAESPAILTIGYEGRALESYLNELLRAGVTLLCDVRRNPISRKYGFSKRTLANACSGVGIRYEHLPELGIASEQRRGLETQADYEALFATYECDVLPDQEQALGKIEGWVQSGDRVALTCYEKLPHQCHRRRVTSSLEHRLGHRFAARHL